MRLREKGVEMALKMLKGDCRGPAKTRRVVEMQIMRGMGGTLSVSEEMSEEKAVALRDSLVEKFSGALEKDSPLSFNFYVCSSDVDFKNCRA